MNLLDFLIIFAAIFGAVGTILYVGEKGRPGWYVFYCWVVGSMVGGFLGLSGFLIVSGGFLSLAFLFSKKLNFRKWLKTSKEDLYNNRRD